jgi:uncharacterized delta-60 repeat protein
MKTKLLAAAMSLFLGATMSLSAQWARTYGGKKDDRAWSVIQDAAGNFVLAGTTVSFGNGSINMWILKLSPEGKILWQRTYASSSSDYPSVTDEAFSIELARDGRYVAAGTTTNSERYGNGYRNYPFIEYLKLRTDGGLQWQKKVPPIISIPDRAIWRTTLESARCLRGSADGSFILVGQLQWGELHDFIHWSVSSPFLYALKIDKQGIVRFRKIYGSDAATGSALSAVPLPAGGYLISGRAKLAGRSDYEFLLLKIGYSGDAVWSYSYGGSGTEEVHDLALTEDGGCVLAGPTRSFGTGGYDAWVLRLDASGEILWQKAYGGPKDDYAHAVWTTRDGGFVVAGSTSSFGAGSEDVWVFKLDKDGNIVWQMTYGGKGLDGAWAVREIKPSGYIVAGKTSSYGAGEEDALVLRLDKNGQIDASCGTFMKPSAAQVTKTKCSPNPISMWTYEYSEGPFEFAASMIRFLAKGSPTVICKKAK